MSSPGLPAGACAVSLAVPPDAPSPRFPAPGPWCPLPPLCLRGCNRSRHLAGAGWWSCRVWLLAAMSSEAHHVGAAATIPFLDLSGWMTFCRMDTPIRFARSSIEGTWGAPHFWQRLRQLAEGVPGPPAARREAVGQGERVWGPSMRPAPREGRSALLKGAARPQLEGPRALP